MVLRLRAARAAAPRVLQHAALLAGTCRAGVNNARAHQIRFCTHGRRRRRRSCEPPVPHPPSQPTSPSQPTRLAFWPEERHPQTEQRAVPCMPRPCMPAGPTTHQLPVRLPSPCTLPRRCPCHRRRRDAAGGLCPPPTHPTLTAMIRPASSPPLSKSILSPLVLASPPLPSPLAPAPHAHTNPCASAPLHCTPTEPD